MDVFIMIFGALLSVMNPLGTIPIFVSLTKENNKKERHQIAFWTSFNVLIILLISFFAGKYILVFFGISLNSLKVAGGLIIASSGFALLTGKFSKHKGMKQKSVKEGIKNRSEFSLTPLAIPMIAGPGTISLLIAYNQKYDKLYEVFLTLGAIVLSVICIYLVLKSSFFITKSLGASGINALSRIIGFIVISIGVEFIISAVLPLFHRV
ncbi:MarC family NAAT transporter [Xanthomarina sp. GH4-25]|uniref:MarC family NAAT transporter n=1 Tax=Xanthomarina sp. GH4-25 TaxID=3349335 RepID=UPI00387803F0